MSASDLLAFLADLLYVAVFLLAAVRAVRNPRPATIDTAIFFGLATLIVLETWLFEALGVAPPPLAGELAGTGILILPYVLLRLVDDFSGVPRALLWGAAAGMAAAVGILFLAPSPPPGGLLVYQLAYFIGLTAYAAVAFGRAAGMGTGVTRRRLGLLSAGTIFLAIDILFAGLQALVPAGLEAWELGGQVMGLLSGVAYLLGFVPPTWLKRAWQEPELRAFLVEAASVPRLPDLAAIRKALEESAGRVLGSQSAYIGLWNEAAGMLEFDARHHLGQLAGPAQELPWQSGGDVLRLPPNVMVAGQAFTRRQPIFAPDVGESDPANARLYLEFGIAAVLAAPILGAAGAPLGVLVLYTSRAPLFVEDDLRVVELLASQAALILESRALIDEAAQVRAREEADRLKNDFLSSAAHDLQTPLTSVLLQAQFLDRLAREGKTDPAATERMVGESRHLKLLIQGLIEVSDSEPGQLVDKLETVDLRETAQVAMSRARSHRHELLLDAPEPVVGEFDGQRVRQLFEQLLDNAVKFSPEGGAVRVRIWSEDQQAHVTVSDEGVGIPSGDVSGLFQRFRRASNVDDRHYVGMGLGLYFCRLVAEQHGGTIAMEPAARGTTVHVTLPRSLEQVPA